MSGKSLSRRDFVSGVALATAGWNLSPLDAVAQGLLPQAALGADYYPPSLTGLRGSHPGSFEIAHAVAREGRSFSVPEEQTESGYDLVVVGGGISGLAAAKFFRSRHGSSSRILILDNHDDFGGHARRNEFEIDGRKLIGYGGSQNLQTPSRYSKVAKQLLLDLNIHVDRFYQYFDDRYLEKLGLEDRAGMYLDAKTFGRRVLVDNLINPWRDTAVERSTTIAALPISDEDKVAFTKLLEGGVDYLPGQSVDEKLQTLNDISYLDFLRERAGMPDSVLELIRDSFLGMIGVGWEADSALYAARYGFPGTEALKLPKQEEVYEPYIHHFPDGNASLARALVRDLIPGAIPGSTMEDIVTARANYAELDRAGSPIRLRLNSTVVNARNVRDGVDVTYINGDRAFRVRARHAVMACYNQILPHICTDMGESQAQALRNASKTPYVIGSIALRNWRAFRDAGYFSIYSPGDVLFKNVGLDFPVSMGDYQFSRGPDDPIVIDAWHSPTARGLPVKEQYRAGRAKMLEMSFKNYENDIFEHFNGMLGPHGFDAERDIAAITLNRWPHGYAYEYEGIGVPQEYDRHHGPHITGRARIGRISIANSDSEAYAYADGAIDAADRAVDEQLRL